MHDPGLAANKAQAQRYVDEIRNGHRLEALSDIFAEDVTDYTASGCGAFVGGFKGLKDGQTAVLAAFPDLSATVEALIAEGDKVVARKTLKGTRRGEGSGIPASGNAVESSVRSSIRSSSPRSSPSLALSM